VGMVASITSTSTWDAGERKRCMGNNYLWGSPAKIRLFGLTGTASTTLRQLTSGFLIKLLVVPFPIRPFH
jgi:hypothetical protein